MTIYVDFLIHIALYCHVEIKKCFADESLNTLDELF